MRKNYKIIIRVSQSEKQTLESKARKSGMKLSQFLRFLGLRAKIRELYAQL